VTPTSEKLRRLMVSANQMLEQMVAVPCHVTGIDVIGDGVALRITFQIEGLTEPEYTLCPIGCASPQGVAQSVWMDVLLATHPQVRADIGMEPNDLDPFEHADTDDGPGSPYPDAPINPEKLN